MGWPLPLLHYGRLVGKKKPQINSRTMLCSIAFVPIWEKRVFSFWYYHLFV
jgi:hypothetical protein